MHRLRFPRRFCFGSPLLASPFIATWHVAAEDPYGVELLSAPTPIAPRGRRSFRFDTKAINEHAGWFYDARLRSPGNYRLQVFLLDDAREAILPTDASRIEIDLPVRLASNVATLSIVAPSGDDARIFEHLLRHATKNDDGAPYTWLSNDLIQTATWVLDEFPASTYAPYLAAMYDQSDRERRAAAIERVLERQPDTPLRAALLFYQGVEEEVIAQEAELSPTPNADRANYWYARARRHLAEAEKAASDPQVQERSRDIRRNIPSPSEVRARIAERQRMINEP